MLEQAPSLFKRVAVAEDLGAITRYDPTEEADPTELGMRREDVASIWAAAEDVYRTGMHPALSLCLRRGGRVVLKRSIGHARGNAPGEAGAGTAEVATPETPICLFSASKAITAMLIHLLHERGELDLLDPVKRYLPAFGAAGKGNVTIYHLLTHRAGIPMLPREAAPEAVFDYDACVRMLCEAKPIAPGGHRMAYHAVTGGFILGEILRVVTGMGIREFLRANIQEPMGFNYFNFGMPPEQRRALAENAYTGVPVKFPLSVMSRRIFGVPWAESVRLSNDPRLMDAVIPAGNIACTADEASQFFQMLLNGGELNGKRYFAERTVQRATADNEPVQFDRTMLLPMRYSPGMMLGSDPVGLFGPNSRRAFGHLGYMNNFCWADPDRDISVAILNTGKAALGPHLPAVARLLSRINRSTEKPGTVRQRN